MQEQSNFISVLRSEKCCLIIPQVVKSFQTQILLDLCDCCGVPHTKNIYRDAQNHKILVVAFERTLKQLKQQQEKNEIYQDCLGKGKSINPDTKELSKYCSLSVTQSIKKYEKFNPIMENQFLDELYRKQNENSTYQVGVLTYFRYKLMLTIFQMNKIVGLSSKPHWKQLIKKQKDKQEVWLIGVCSSIKIACAFLNIDQQDSTQKVELQVVTSCLILRKQLKKQAETLKNCLQKRSEIREEGQFIILDFIDNEYSIEAYKQTLVNKKELLSLVKFGFSQSTASLGYFSKKPDQKIDFAQCVKNYKLPIKIVSEFSGRQNIKISKCLFYENPELLKYQHPDLLDKRLQIATDQIYVHINAADEQIIKKILDELQIDEQEGYQITNIEKPSNTRSEQIVRKIQFTVIQDSAKFFQKAGISEKIQRVRFQEVF